MVVMGSIIADEYGLYWRNLWRQRYALWEDVSAFYDQRMPGTANVGKFPAAEKWQRVVKTSAGTLTFDEGEWRNERQMRDWIRAHATAARLQAWGEMRRNPEDWPLVFHYDTPTNRNVLRWLHQWHWIGLAAFVVYYFWVWQTTHVLLNWGWLLTPTGLFFLGKQVLPLTVRRTYRRTQPYLDCKIRADGDGLTFIDGEARAAVAWDEILGVRRHGLRSVIVTECGEWDFLETLTDSETLHRLLSRYAPKAGRFGSTWQVQGRHKRLSEGGKR